MRVVAVAAAGLLVSGCLVTRSQYDLMAQEADSQRQQHEAAAKSAAELEKQLAEERAARAAADAKIAEATAENRELVAKNEELTALSQELAKSTKQLEAVKAELEKKSSQYESLAESLKGEIEAGRIELSELKGRMTVKMKDKILFGSGSARLAKEGMAALDKVAEALKDIDGKIVRVEGHTDSDPVDPKGPYASNWDLSIARAMAVVAHLQERGVDPTKLSAAGYGQYQPIAANTTPEKKSLNRRIEIVLAPALPGAPTVAGSKAPKSKTAKNSP